MEARILLAIHEHSSPFWDRFFLVSHYLGSTAFCALLVVAAALFFRLHGDRREAALWIALGLMTFILQAIIKSAVERPRPQLWVSAVTLTNFAFPSGHAVASATFYPLIARGISKRKPRLTVIAYSLAGLMALYVGFGRLYLGAHWPTDVIAGWSIGAVQTAFALWLFDRRLAPAPSAAAPVPSRSD